LDLLKKKRGEAVPKKKYAKVSGRGSEKREENWGGPESSKAAQERDPMDSQHALDGVWTSPKEDKERRRESVKRGKQDKKTLLKGHEHRNEMANHWKESEKAIGITQAPTMSGNHEKGKANNIDGEVLKVVWLTWEPERRSFNLSRGMSHEAREKTQKMSRNTLEKNPF